MSRNKNFVVRVAWIPPQASGFDVNIQPANAPHANGLPGEQAMGQQLEEGCEQTLAVLCAYTSFTGKHFLKLGSSDDRSFGSHKSGVIRGYFGNLVKKKVLTISFI
jgi:hypothetical protein